MHNVSRAMLERLAPCLGCDVTDKWQLLTSRNVGVCRSFHVDLAGLLPPHHHQQHQHTSPPHSRDGSLGGQPTAAAAAAAQQQHLMNGGGVVGPAPAPLTHLVGARALAATVLLRGAGLERLVRVKRVVRFLVQVRCGQEGAVHDGGCAGARGRGVGPGMPGVQAVEKGALYLPHLCLGSPAQLQDRLTSCSPPLPDLQLPSLLDRGGWCPQVAYHARLECAMLAAQATAALCALGEEGARKLNRPSTLGRPLRSAKPAPLRTLALATLALPLLHCRSRTRC